jgi:hypothetical protein
MAATSALRHRHLSLRGGCFPADVGFIGKLN